MKQFVITPSMGKRLIARALCEHPAVLDALQGATLAIVAGSTNGYVAEELLKRIGQAEGFSRQGFRRGLVTPPGAEAPAGKLDGDVVIRNGAWQRGKTIFDVVGDLAAGDVVLKGANAIDLRRGHAGCYIGHPQGGTIGAILPAVIGRRVRLIVPAGLEKRISADIADIAADLNDPETEGPRMVQLPGELFTELDAIALLTGAAARLLAGGGIYGAEGCVWVGVRGSQEQMQTAAELIHSIQDEGPCRV